MVTNEGLMVNQQLKIITKPKFELEPHQLQEWYILLERGFYKKKIKIAWLLSLQWHFGNLCSLYES